MKRKTPSRNKILSYVKKNKKARVEELRTHLGVSRQLIHKQLNRLIKEDAVVKSGKPPLVFYETKGKDKITIIPNVPSDIRKYINSHYLWVSPTGEILSGFEGFKGWVSSTNQVSQISFLANEYVIITLRLT